MFLVQTRGRSRDLYTPRPEILLHRGQIDLVIGRHTLHDMSVDVELVKGEERSIFEVAFGLSGTGNTNDIR
jgi:hypothetical protein